MSLLLDQTATTVRGSTGAITFQTQGGGAWKVWDRYLAIDGRRAVHIGNICDTCAFFFERCAGAGRNVDVPELSERLRRGLAALDPATIDAVCSILPNGRYRALLLRATPRLVQPGEPDDYFSHEQVELWGIDRLDGKPHSPKTDYYRLSSRVMGDGRCLFEFLVPTFPRMQLSRDTLESYAAHLAAGAMPTALALAVLDVKQPADWDGDPSITSHWCLAHYLLDGHHKVLAAARAGLPLTVLSLLALKQGISSEAHIEEALSLLKTDIQDRLP